MANPYDNLGNGHQTRSKLELEQAVELYVKALATNSELGSEEGKLQRQPQGRSRDTR